MAVRISMQSTEQEVANLPSIVCFSQVLLEHDHAHSSHIFHAAGATTAQVVVTETIWPTKL